MVIVCNLHARHESIMGARVSRWPGGLNESRPGPIDLALGSTHRFDFGKVN
jgi:hypothetical protein